jgi:archaellum biogenesis protein FlaJ (TadC family)
MTLVSYLVSHEKLIKKRLRMANIKQTPEQYVAKSVKFALTFSGVLSIIMFFLFSTPENPNIALPLLAFVVMLFYLYKLNMKKIDVGIKKRAKAIDAHVLFAGRYLLIKLNSGKPLINYFKQIVRDIHLGTPLEQALDKATEYCPSKNLKKILFQITNALKIGVDVTNFLQAILDEISDEQLTEILRYGKKLSSLSMFYMLAAVIVPSLGMTLFVIVASLISLDLDMTAFTIIVVILFFIQFIFITMFKSSRPNMDV